MKIYMIEYIGSDDNTHAEYFSNKLLADKRHKKLIRQHEKDKSDFDIAEDDEMDGIKQVYDISEINLLPSKKGIMKMLQIHFNER